VKLKTIGCGLTPLERWGAELRAFSSEEIETLAQMEHARWVDERKAAGWTYAPGNKDLENQTSPYLVPWEELTEDIKEIDRETVRSLPSFWAQAGFEVCSLAKG
jgi:hypothetical protein